LDGVLARADGVEFGERLREPVAEFACAHGGDGAVESGVE
jgi:hypothetical protein